MPRQTLEQAAERRKETIKELASRIHEQKRDAHRLHAKANAAEDRYARLRAVVEARGAYSTHDADCHVTTCPELEGCEERDAGYLGTYMDHDCSCGVDRLRYALDLGRIRPAKASNYKQEEK